MTKRQKEIIFALLDHYPVAERGASSFQTRRYIGRLLTSETMLEKMRNLGYLKISLRDNYKRTYTVNQENEEVLKLKGVKKY